MSLLDFLKASDVTGISQALRRLASSVLDALGRFFDSLFQAELHVEDNARMLHDNFVKLHDNIPRQIARVKNFEFDPRWQTRVINVPIAIDQMKSLIEEVTQGWETRLDSFREPLHEFILIFKSESLQSGDPNEQVSGISKAAVKIDEIATLIQQLANASNTLVEIDTIFDDILNFLGGLDQLFLQQNNERKIVKGKSRIRVGKLHS